MAKYVVVSTIDQKQIEVEAASVDFDNQTQRTTFKDGDGAIVGMFMNVSFHKAPEPAAE